MTLSAADQKLLTPDQLTWPLSFRFTTQAPWGETRQELSVDAPGLAGSIEGSMALGEELWRRVVAPATSRDVSLLTWDTVVWKLAPVPFTSAPIFAKGLLSRTAAPRADTPVVVMHSGHTDDRGTRRFFLAGSPLEWSHEGVLTNAGKLAAEGWAQMAVMGLCSHLTGSPFVWLLAYPRALPESMLNPSGVAFRRVEFLRVPTLTEKAPDPSGASWPA